MLCRIIKNHYFSEDDKEIGQINDRLKLDRKQAGTFISIFNEQMGANNLQANLLIMKKLATECTIANKACKIFGAGGYVGIKNYPNISDVKCPPFATHRNGDPALWGFFIAEFTA